MEMIVGSTHRCQHGMSLAHTKKRTPSHTQGPSSPSPSFLATPFCFAFLFLGFCRVGPFASFFPPCLLFFDARQTSDRVWSKRSQASTAASLCDGNQFSISSLRFFLSARDCRFFRCRRMLLLASLSPRLSVTLEISARLVRRSLYYRWIRDSVCERRNACVSVCQ